MALVAYSDSEGSDAETQTTLVPAIEKSKNSDSGVGFQIDRSNPRKIRVALPELRPEHSPDHNAEQGPARKKARRDGGSGGVFSGFNALLPAPKRTAEKKAPVASTRKIFSLKTGAEPGFDRDADTEMRNANALTSTVDNHLNADTIHTEGDSGLTTATPENQKKIDPGEVRLQGNPMMFRPLSVIRTQKKKKTNKTSSQPTPPALVTSKVKPTSSQAQDPDKAVPASISTSPQPPKPKTSLFFSSLADRSTQADSLPMSTGMYQPLVYNRESEPTPGEIPTAADPTPAASELSSSATVTPSLDNIANDLNLSSSERRQLFGRNALSADSRILTFETDKEYASNKTLAQTEFAAVQHNPIRSIAAGGKHSLRQLVNAATSQKEALEESFAAGRRNKKEAGAKYGW